MFVVGGIATVLWQAHTGGSATLTITQPDGTAFPSPPTPSASSSTFSAVFTPTQPGRHQLLWTHDDDTIVADIADVWPAQPRYLVSVQDALERLRLGAQAAKSYDSIAMLGLYVAAATAIVENVTGPLLPDDKTWTCLGADVKYDVLLPHTGIAVSTVTVDGVALVATDYTVDAAAGIISSGAFTSARSVVVTYTVGSTTIPPQARLACLEVIAQMWQVSRQGLREAGAVEETFTTPMGFALPKRAWEMLQSLKNTPGLA
ncbi:hypothetical protein [Demequina gelatinilytica]|uniref:hypothetical protein n=1 Tax=Demequina gelatinilytica TaxID=1638980 RepID=UPI0007808036|nr:hypothetical protein [Demequina gelatinilytica]